MRYPSDGIIGKRLRENVELKSTDDIQHEKKRMSDCLDLNLDQATLVKDNRRKELQIRLQETRESIKKTIKEKDEMTRAFHEEMERIQEKTAENIRDHETFKLLIESEKQELEMCDRALKEREENIDGEIIKLRLLRNEMASAEHEKSEENVLRLLQEQKREKEELHRKISELQKEIDEALELEIQQVRGAAQVMEHMERDAETKKKKMEEINEELKEKEEELEDLEDRAQYLIVKERKSNDVLQAARKELIIGLEYAAKGNCLRIGVKRMGSLDLEEFEKVAKDKYPSEHVPTKAEELRALCQSYIEDCDWLPFKIVTEHMESTRK